MINVRFERSGAVYEAGKAAKGAPEQADGGTYEWVQLTYETLRVSPDGETLAFVNPAGDWIRTSDGSVWSDIVIG